MGGTCQTTLRSLPLCSRWRTAAIYYCRLLFVSGCHFSAAIQFVAGVGVAVGLCRSAELRDWCYLWVTLVVGVFSAVLNVNVLTLRMCSDAEFSVLAVELPSTMLMEAVRQVQVVSSSHLLWAELESSVCYSLEWKPTERERSHLQRDCLCGCENLVGNVADENLVHIVCNRRGRPSIKL